MKYHKRSLSPIQRDVQMFREKLAALEKEEALFSLAQQWQDRNHLARVRSLLYELRVLENQLRHSFTANTALRFLIEQTLWRFQSFKSMHRRFWEALSDEVK
ncbi:MAG: hypothetical protein D6736_10755 [Nitrospinota bacterium]|nr:MAG: hypothetical protein D6736_10755 [Nitrospinota bacterium]